MITSQFFCSLVSSSQQDLSVIDHHFQSGLPLNEEPHYTTTL